MSTAAGESDPIMKSQWRILLAVLYAALARLLNEVYGNVIFSLAPVEEPSRLHGVHVKYGLLFRRLYCF